MKTDRRFGTVAECTPEVRQRTRKNPDSSSEGGLTEGSDVEYERSRAFGRERQFGCVFPFVPHFSRVRLDPEREQLVEIERCKTLALARRLRCSVVVAADSWKLGSRARSWGARDSGTAGQRDKPLQTLVPAALRLSRQLSQALQFVPAGAGESICSSLFPPSRRVASAASPEGVSAVVMASSSLKDRGRNGGRNRQRRAVGASEIAVAHAEVRIRVSLHNFGGCAFMAQVL